MLQQTQVTTVIPYYEKFLHLFPRIQDLANAPTEKVLSAWAGLGYYSRARNLHKAAKVISWKLQGEFPQEREALLQVPGIGPYTAGAVLSIAFDKPVPLVDGNVERVFSRLFAITDPIKDRAVQKQLWKYAEASVLLAESPRVFNQALMELGALVCTKGTPRCGNCPIQTFCQAFQMNIQETLPIKAPRRESESLWWLGLVFENQGKLLLRQNGEGDWWNGLWDFPHLALASEKSLEAKEKKLFHDYVGAQEILPLALVKHTVTHHKIHFRPFKIRVRKNLRSIPNGQWFAPSELENLPLSALARKVVQHMLE